MDKAPVEVPVYMDTAQAAEKVTQVAVIHD
jgi:hypothetical protein